MENSPEGRPISRNRAALATLGTICAVAALLRFGGLEAQSLWWDEVLTTYSAREPTTHVIGAVRGHENAPPFYFIVMNVWAKAFGMSDLSLRVPSALIGCMTVLLMWRVGREWFDDVVGLTAAGLLAVSPIHIAYSQEARMYALMVFLLLLNLWAFIRLTRSGSTAAQVAYLVTAVLALLTHTFAAFTLIAVNGFWLIRLARRGETGVTLRRWIMLNLAVVVLFGPWVPATMEVARMGLPWLTKSTTFSEAVVGYTGTLAFMPTVGLSCVGIGWAVRWRNDRVLLLVLLVLVPILGPITYGQFTTRYGIAALIGLTMLAAYGASGLGRWMCVCLVLVAALGWTMTSTLGQARYLNYTPKVDVRAVVRHVQMRPEGGRNVVSTSRGVWHVLEHYVHGTTLHLYGDLDAVKVHRPPRLWLVAPDLATAEAGAAESGYVILTRRDFDGLVLLQLHRRREPATTAGVSSAYPRN